MCFLTFTGLLQTDRVLRSTHVTALVRDRSEQLRAEVDPLRDFVEVSIIMLALFTCLFNNRVPRRCVTNAQLLQVIVDCAGDTHERFRGTLTQLA